MITSHVNDEDGLGRMPKEMYAVKIQVRNEGSRAKTYAYTYDRKPDAMRHYLAATKFGEGTKVSLLRAQLAWEEVDEIT